MFSLSIAFSGSDYADEAKFRLWLRAIGGCASFLYTRQNQLGVSRFSSIWVNPHGGILALDLMIAVGIASCRIFTGFEVFSHPRSH